MTPELWLMLLTPVSALVIGAFVFYQSRRRPDPRP